MRQYKDDCVSYECSGFIQQKTPYCLDSLIIPQRAEQEVLASSCQERSLAGFSLDFSGKSCGHDPGNSRSQSSTPRDGR